MIGVLAEKIHFYKQVPVSSGSNNEYAFKMTDSGSVEPIFSANNDKNMVKFKGPVHSFNISLITV